MSITGSNNFTTLVNSPYILTSLSYTSCQWISTAPLGLSTFNLTLYSNTRAVIFQQQSVLVEINSYRKFTIYNNNVKNTLIQLLIVDTKFSDFMIFIIVKFLVRQIIFSPFKIL